MIPNSRHRCSSVDLALVLDGKHVAFRGDTDLEPGSVAELQKVIKLYRTLWMRGTSNIECGHLHITHDG